MFQSSRSEEVGCGLKGMLASGNRVSFSPLEARKWAAGACGAYTRPISLFQSSRSEEVGCGFPFKHNGTAKPLFQSSRSEEVGCG